MKNNLIINNYLLIIMKVCIQLHSTLLLSTLAAIVTTSIYNNWTDLKCANVRKTAYENPFSPFVYFMSLTGSLTLLHLQFGNLKIDK